MTYTKFINCATLSIFNTNRESGIIGDSDLVFIESTNQIWTHDVFYSCPYTKEQIDSMISSAGDGDSLTKENIERVLTGNITSHTHSYANKVTVGSTAYNVSNNNISIPAYPTALKSPNSLVLRLNTGSTEGTNKYTYDGSAGKTLDIKSGSNVTLTAGTGTLTISSTNTTYSQANASTLGLVKIGYTESGKNYPVELNSSGQMYVNVPWTDNNTTYGVATTSANGLLKQLDGSTSHYMRGDGTWATPPNTTYGLVGANGTSGLVKNGSTVTSSSGYTACPIISGVPYYKDTNTTYNLGSFGITATAAELNYCDGVTSNIQTQLNGKAASSHSHSYLPLAGGTLTGTLTLHTNGTGAYNQGIRINRVDKANWATLTIGYVGAGTANTSGDTWLIGTPANSSSLIFNRNSSVETSGLCLKGHGNNDMKWNNNTVWHAGNDGSGSGLDADLLDGLHQGSFLRTDGSNQAVTLTGGNGNTQGYRLVFETAANSAWQVNGATFLINSRHSGTGILSIIFHTISSDATSYTGSVNYYGGMDSFGDDMWRLYYNTSTKKLRLFWRYYDYNSCSISILNKSGLITGVSNGTWYTSIPSDSGVELPKRYNRVASADYLATARSINGTNFNGSGNITTANWGTARTITIGSTGKSVNGGGNVSWSLSEIGAAAASHSHSYLPLSGGTMTGQIKANGTSTSWVTGRNVALLRMTGSGASAYMPIISAKTYNGSWEMGSYTSNTLHFSYITDTNFNSNNNVQTANITFQSNGHIAAAGFDGNASTASKLGSSTVGSGTNPIYLSSGTASACSGRTVPAIKSLSTKSHSNWGTGENSYVPDMTFIAYWNGAYNSGNSSNLTYSASGVIIASGNWTNYVTYIPRDRGQNTVTTLASLPVTKSTVIANLSAATNISLAANMNIGESITVICTPSASFTQPIPTSGAFTSMDGSSLSVSSGKKFEINIYCYNTNVYSISCKTAK